MGIHTNINGTVKVHKSKHISLEKLILMVFTDPDYNVDQVTDCDCYIYNMNINLDYSDLCAVKDITEFVDILEQCNSVVDLTSSIRWYR